MTTATRPRRLQPGSPGFARQVRGIVRDVLAQSAFPVTDTQRRMAGQAARKGRR